MKYFSMFSGIGGFEYGLQQSQHDFECIGYSEIDKYARSIYERHYPNHINYGDATRIDTKDLQDFEFLVGGFPCQAFSIAGKRKGFNEARGTLFFEIARILRDKQPRYFLLENVKGLLSHEGGATLETIFRVCDELGYDVSWKIYNSRNYGVPQHRERIFIKGYNRKKCGQEVLSQFGTITETIVREGGELIQINNYKETTQSNRVYDSNGLSITLNASGNNGIYMIDDNKGVTTTTTNDFFAVTTRCRQMPLSKKQDNYVFEGKSVRRLTPIECERLQGFPDNWTKYGKDNELISDTQRYKCCGNAVTTNVITAIVNEMFEEVKV